MNRHDVRVRRRQTRGGQSAGLKRSPHLQYGNTGRRALVNRSIWPS